jgi:hypothetical protein
MLPDFISLSAGFTFPAVGVIFGFGMLLETGPCFWPEETARPRRRNEHPRKADPIFTPISPKAVESDSYAALGLNQEQDAPKAYFKRKVGCSPREWRYFPKTAARWTLNWVEVIT